MYTINKLRASMEFLGIPTLILTIFALLSLARNIIGIWLNEFNDETPQKGLFQYNTSL